MSVYSMVSRIGIASAHLYEPTSEWRREVYSKISCSYCWDVLPQYRDIPIDVELSAMIDPKDPLPAFKHFIALGLIRTDLLCVLTEWIRGYRIGSVSCSGKALPEFRSVLAGTSVRVRSCGDERSRVDPCKLCGRLCIATPNEYFKPGDIGDKQVFSNVAGVGWTVSERVRNAIPRVIYRKLKFFPVPVRE